MQCASIRLRRSLSPVVKSAVKQNGLAIHFASNALQNNRRIVEWAVQQCGLALEFVPVFQDDYEIAKFAINQNGEAFKFVSPRIAADRRDSEIGFKTR